MANDPPTRQQPPQPPQIDESTDPNDQPRSAWVRAVLHPTRMPVFMLLSVILIGLFMNVYAPGFHQQVFVGGVEESADLAEFEAEQNAKRQQLVETGVSGVAIAEWDERKADDRGRYVEARNEAMLERAEKVKLYLIVCMAIALSLATVEAIASKKGPVPQSIARLGSYIALSAGVLILAARPESFGLSRNMLLLALLVLAIAASANTFIALRNRNAAEAES